MPQTAADPLPIYSIPMETLARSDNPLAAARQHGWRVLTAGSYGLRLVDLKGVEADATPNVTRGQRSAALLEKVGQFASETAPKNVTFEARLLDFPSLGLSALWLHTQDSADRFFPLEAVPREMTADELMATARLNAQRRINRAEGGGGGATPYANASDRSSVERGG